MAITPNDAVFDSRYQQPPNPLDPGSGDIHNLSYDLAFLRLGVAHNAGPYPAVRQINESYDQASQPGVFNSNVNTIHDVYRVLPPVGTIASWFLGPQVYTVGYPYTVNGVDNSNSGIPYYDPSGYIFGYPITSQTTVKELAYLCSTCLPMVGVESFVSQGDSGGPILATTTDGGYTELVGITSAAVVVGNETDIAYYTNYMVGTGWFQHNSSFFADNYNWNPGYPIQITSPATGSTYDSMSVPNLGATAGTYSSNIQWSSSVDGALGVGQTVPVGGKLTQGPQTITAKLVASGSVPAGQMTTTFSVTAGPSSLIASPPKVLVPTGSSTGSVALNWTAPSYRFVDVVQTINSQTTTILNGVNSTSSTLVSVLPGSTYTFTIYNHGNRTVALSSTIVKTAAAPTLSANPNPVITSSGAGSTTISWNATSVSGLGVQLVALFVNDPTTGSTKTIVTGSAALSGSITVPWITTGHTFRFYLYPSDNHSNADQTFQLGIVDVSGVQPGSLTTPVNPVVLPANQTTTHFSLSWSGPGFSTFDLYGAQSLQSPGTIFCLGQLHGTTGTTMEPDSAGQVTNLYLVPSTACVPGSTVSHVPSPILASLTITTAPTLVASPEPVPIPTGQTSARFTLSWTTTTAKLDLYGYQNLSSPNQIFCLGQLGGPNGSTTEPTAIGQVTHLYIVRSSNCVAGTIVSAVPTPILASTVVRSAR